MIIEYTNDGRPLFFSVVNDRGTEFGGNLLSEALYQALEHGINEIVVSAYSDGKEEVLERLDVNKVLRDFYKHSFPEPLQYKYIEHGGIEYVE